MAHLFSFEPLTVMISSRCVDPVMFKGRMQALSAVREAIKARLESIQIDARQIFKVWIHEDESDEPRDQSTWEKCMEKARQADLVLVLYNGNAGWRGTINLTDSIGICHAEYEQAYSRCPRKVYSIQFANNTSHVEQSDLNFQRYFANQKVAGKQVRNGDDAVNACVEVASSGLLRLARDGVGINSRGNSNTGEALSWNRLDYKTRREITTKVILKYLDSELWSDKKLPHNTAIYQFQDDSVALVCDCVPASFSTATARELVGQPFLRDHQIVPELPEHISGPVHVIACQKGVTETQALRQLGFPDATVVSAPFGVYVADNIQKIQMVFIANCRDETSTRHNLQRFLEWLTEQGEDKFLIERAKARREIANLYHSLSFSKAKLTESRGNGRLKKPQLRNSPRKVSLTK